MHNWKKPGDTVIRSPLEFPFWGRRCDGPFWAATNLFVKGGGHGDTINLGGNVFDKNGSPAAAWAASMYA